MADDDDLDIYAMNDSSASYFSPEKEYEQQDKQHREEYVNNQVDFLSVFFLLK